MFLTYNFACMPIITYRLTIVRNTYVDDNDHQGFSSGTKLVIHCLHSIFFLRNLSNGISVRSLCCKFVIVYHIRLTIFSLYVRIAKVLKKINECSIVVDLRTIPYSTLNLLISGAKI